MHCCLVMLGRLEHQLPGLGERATVRVIPNYKRNVGRDGERRESERDDRFGTWLPDGYSQILRSYVFCLWASRLWPRYATLQNLIPSFPWIAPPRPPPWPNPRKGRDQILPSGNLAHWRMSIGGSWARSATRSCVAAAAPRAPTAARRTQR